MAYVFEDTKEVIATGENVQYTDDYIISKFDYETTQVTVVKEQKEGGEGAEGKAAKAGGDVETQGRKERKYVTAKPVKMSIEFRTERKLPKVGVMLVGWGGNNGTTVTAGILANKLNMSWRTKETIFPTGDGDATPSEAEGQKANYYGSVTQCSTIRLGIDDEGNDYFVPFNSLVPMVHPNDLVLGGWDINKMNLGDAMRRAKVLDVSLQDKIFPHLKDLKPLKSIYDEDFIALNQKSRADNVLEGSKFEQMNQIVKDIEDFKAANGVEKVIVLWTANTERFCEVREGLNDTADTLLASIKNNEKEVSPSTLFAVASILTKSSYINGSPQNTFVPGVIELARKHKVFISGDDFKSGQTKIKSVLVDFLVSAGIKPVSIVSYNHLGNNDGKNLSAPQQFKSKEISKSNVVDDMVASNGLLFKKKTEVVPGSKGLEREVREHPDHCVVIKYVPYVGDSKRAMDEYTSEIFLGGKNTISMHNTCEDSLLATPLIIDLIILTELFERISFKVEDREDYESFHSILSLLSYLLKAPLTPEGAPVVNALFPQRQAITNFLRACIGLPPENHMSFEHRIN